MKLLTDPKIKLVLVGGKGGVGKTTIASSLAIGHGRRNPDKKILLASTDPAHSLCDAFEIAFQKGIIPLKIFPNLHLLQIDSQEAFNRFKQEQGSLLRTLALRGTILDEEDLDAIFALCPPGLDEMMGILEIFKQIELKAYDLVILDTAPTGHTLRLLEMPWILEEWLRVFFLMQEKYQAIASGFSRSKIQDECDLFLERFSKSIHKLQNLLKDPVRAHFIWVTHPEEIPLAQTQGTIKFLTDHHFPIQTLIANKVWEKKDCPVCQHLWDRQISILKEFLDSIHVPQVVFIPLENREVHGIEDLSKIGKILFESPEPPLEIRPPKKPAPPEIEKHSNKLVNLIPQENKMILFGGKGGVGKTTLATGTALCLARAHRSSKILLASMDPAHSISKCLNISIGEGPFPLPNIPNLYIQEMNFQKRFQAFREEYQDMMPRPREVDLPYDRRIMEALSNSQPPGLEELMGLLEIVDLFEGSPTYDLVVIDMAPTGHCLRLLELPDKAGQWIEVLLKILLKYQGMLTSGKGIETLTQLAHGIKKIKKLLTDPTQISLFIVTLPEAMSILETYRFLGELQSLKISCKGLVVNRMIQKGSCEFCQSIHKQQNDYLNVLRKDLKRLPVITIPEC